MKVKKFLYSLLLMLIASFFAIQPTLAITAVQLEMFVENNIMFYDPEDTYADNCYTSSAHLVEETDRASIIWNWFVKANIPGVSDHAEVIAGILGNFEQENSAFDPFSWSGWGHGAGLFRATAGSDNPKSRAARFIHKVEEKFGSNIWNTTNTLDAATIKRGIETELEIMIGSDYNWNGSDFPNLLHIPTNKAGEDGAAAYAELFMLVFEIPMQHETVAQFPASYQGGAFQIQDPGVASYEFVKDSTKNTNYFWSFGVVNGQPRRSYLARNHYKRFAGNSVPSHAQNTVSGANITIIDDETISNVEDSLKNTFSGVDIKTANNITEATDLVKNDSSIRENIFLIFDLSRELFGEENLTNLIDAIGDTHKIYLVATSSTTNDNYSNNNSLYTALAGRYSFINIITATQSSDLTTKLSSIFKTPTVSICSGEQPTNFTSQDDSSFVQSNGSGANTPCQYLNAEINGGTIYSGGTQGVALKGKSIRLCAIQGFTSYVNNDSGDSTLHNLLGNSFYSGGTRPVIVSSEAARAWQAFFNDHNEYIKNTFGTFRKQNEKGGWDTYGPAGLWSSSDFRTYEKQKKFWDNYKGCMDKAKAAGYSSANGAGWWKKVEGCSNVNTAANPDTNGSQHETGLAVDIASHFFDSDNPMVQFDTCASLSLNLKFSDLVGDNRWHSKMTKYLCDNLYKYGLRFTVNNEPWHIQYVAGSEGKVNSKK